MKRERGILGFVVLLIIALASVAVYSYFEVEKLNRQTCLEKCQYKGSSIGECLKPIDAKKSYLNIGGCVVEGSKQCGGKEDCTCYCYSGPILGGCGSIQVEFVEDCCENWAARNKVIKPACVGNWKIEENTCEWKC